MLLTFEALGLPFQVACDDRRVLAHIEDLLAGLVATSAAEHGNPRIFVVRGLRRGAPGRIIEALIGTINLAAVRNARGALLLHAGAVVRPGGGTAILCGPSGSGKSTLTTRLVEAGLAYLSDETVCVSPCDLRIAPFRKPVSIKSGAQVRLPHLSPTPGSDAAAFTDRQWLIPPARLGGAPVPSGPLLPELLIFPTYSASDAPLLELLHPAEAAFMLGGNASYLPDITGGPLPALARLARRAPAYRLIYDDVDGARDQVLGLWDALRPQGVPQPSRKIKGSARARTAAHS